MFNKIGLGRWHILPILVAFLNQAASPSQLISSVFTNMPLDFRLVALSSNTSTYDNICIGTNHTHSNVSDSEIEFDHTDFESTFTSEFQLVCSEDWISDLYQLSITVGLAIGSLLGGIGDKWGRLPVIRFGALGCLLGVTMVGFGPNVYIVLVGRLVIGLFCNILNVSSLTLAMENTPTPNRSNICLLIMIGYPLSVTLKGMISYFLRDWRKLHLTLSSFIYLIVVLSYFLDKSLRWLFHNGHFEEGTVLLEKMLKLHNSNKTLADFLPIINGWKSKFNLEEIHKKSEKNLCVLLKNNITIFFKNPAMVSISLTTPIIWFITGLVYFGVPLNANNFTDNPFIYMVFLGVTEVISIILGGIILKRFGNIRTGAVCFTITGGCLLLILTVPEYVWWLKWILILLAMMSISICYALCYILSSELYPTEVKSAGLGICNFFIFIGFSLSSLLSKIALRYSNWIFNVVCSAFCFIAVVLMIFLLPETKGEALCDTTDDVAERSKRLRNKK